jgi:hypothetical protein
MTKKRRWSPLVKRATRRTTGIYRFTVSLKTLIKLGEFAKNPTSPIAAFAIEDPDGYLYHIEFDLKP